MRKLLFTALVVLATGLIASPASEVDPGKGKPGYCPDATGVTVAVDFQGLGGDAIIRCAPGPQASGLGSRSPPCRRPPSRTGRSPARAVCRRRLP